MSPCTKGVMNEPLAAVVRQAEARDIGSARASFRQRARSFGYRSR
jgi:hypothetical protein